MRFYVPISQFKRLNVPSPSWQHSLLRLAIFIRKKIVKSTADRTHMASFKLCSIHFSSVGCKKLHSRKFIKQCLEYVGVTKRKTISHVTSKKKGPSLNLFCFVRECISWGCRLRNEVKKKWTPYVTDFSESEMRSSIDMLANRTHIKSMFISMCFCRMKLKRTRFY